MLILIMFNRNSRFKLMSFNGEIPTPNSLTHFFHQKSSMNFLQSKIANFLRRLYSR